MTRSYDELADALMASGLISDPWIDGRPRFRAEPVFITAQEQRALYDAAEQFASVIDEACRMCDADEALIDEFLKLSPFQKLMWTASQPMWHGLARADVFMTARGPVVCELNSDTPTGEPEAVVLGELGKAAFADAVDPNEGLQEKWLALLTYFADSTLGQDPPFTVGMVYPTELTEDLSLVRLYKRWIEGAGWELVLGSPFNLSQGEDAALQLFETPVDVVIRHYKTDWWAEREPVWKAAAPFPDAAPLDQQLMTVLTSMLEQRCVVINPFGSVVAQNKRLMALMWERIELFSPRAQRVIERLVPETRRLESVSQEQLIAEREAWVLKSDYGAEGEEVIVGKHVTDQLWAEGVTQAVAKHWVVQRYFEALETPSRETINYGVYLIAGEACGLYTRVQGGPTDVYAQSAPALIRDEREPIVEQRS